MFQTLEIGPLTVLQSGRLLACGVPHGFSTRGGGVSAGPFASLNLGQAAAEPRDDARHVAENQVRFAAAVGLADAQLVTLTQVHGNAVHVSSLGGAGHREADAAPPCADAVVLHRGGDAALVRTADCVPILLSTWDGAVVAAVHAGWRGLVAGVIGAAVAALKRQRGLMGDGEVPLCAGIGPCAGVQAYEVGPEVAGAFADAGLEACIDASYGREHVDLAEAARQQLLAAGLAAEDIDMANRCTVSESDAFFSHRRDGGRTGRMGAIIGIKGDG